MAQFDADVKDRNGTWLFGRSPVGTPSRSLRLGLALVVAGIGFAACGSEGSPAAAPATTEIAGVQIQTENIFGGDNVEDKLMPNVVCMDLNSAQDEIQDHGIFLSRSTDATGAGRMQILDGNWIVVSQDPSPGTPISELSAVLSVVKITERHNC